MLTIRLARGGKNKKAHYRIVVTDSRNARDSGAIKEKVGYFNPVAKGNDTMIDIDQERVSHWISKGAQPSEKVAQLIKIFAKAQEKGEAAVMRSKPKKPKKEAKPESETLETDSKDEVKADEAPEAVKAEEASEAEPKAVETEPEAKPESALEAESDSEDEVKADEAPEAVKAEEASEAEPEAVETEAEAKPESAPEAESEEK